ncbi:MAG TPA: hypothetical protein VKH44_05405 [Pirellulaceae bacterium]|nr:hypothetical protein [Pirellulaceae bacterium]
MEGRRQFSLRYLLTETLLLGVALGSMRMLLVDAPITQGRIILVFPLLICLCMWIAGLVKEWKAGAFIGLFLSIIAAFGLLVSGGR